MKKEIIKIFIVLGLFAFSGGIFYSFQELWMAANGLTVKTISVVFSLCALITVSSTFLCSNLIQQKQLKKFASLLILGKIITMSSLFFLNNSGLNVLIKFLIMIDYVLEIELWTCIYPMIATIDKNDKVYGVKDIVYNASYNIGVLVAGLLLGRTILKLDFNYNTYAILSTVLMVVAFIVLQFVHLNISKEAKTEDKIDVLGDLFKKIKNDKISIVYFLFVLFGQVSYCCILSLIMTILTNSINLSPSVASSVVVGMTLASSVLSIIVISKAIIKNNYIVLFIKYAMRFIFYVMAILINNKAIFLIALIYPRLIAEPYSHVTDAPYINRIADKYQLAYCNLREMVHYLGKSIGTLICGIVLTLGIRFNFLFAAIFVAFQYSLSVYGLYLRNKEKKAE